MKQGLLACAALLAWTVSPALAEYVEITVDLSKQDEIKGKQTQEGGMTGMTGMGGVRPPANTGAAGARGALGIGGGQLGVGGGVYGVGGGFRGGRGRRPPFPPIGAAGMGGAAGFRGNLGVLGNQGNFGFGGMGGMAGMAGMSGTPTEPPKIPAKVVIEATSVRHLVYGRTPFVEINHKWGQTILVKSDLVHIKERQIPTIATQYKNKRNQVLKDPTDKKQWLDLASWVLQHGLVKEFPRIMAQVEKLDAKDPAVVAYKKLEAAWKTKPEADEPSAVWIVDRLARKRFEPKVSDHYKLLTTSADKEEINHFLQRLEDAYHGFFYWFALKGKALQVPKYRLVVALIGNPEELKEQLQTFKYLPMAADGVTLPRDNVALVSAKPLDDIYVQLDKLNRGIWRDHSRKDLLKPPKNKAYVPTLERANQGVLALVQTALEEESAQATISHEATLQLLAAAGMPAQEKATTWVPVLARHLAGPEWLKFGLASFFETPYGAYWRGVASPSWRYYIQFKFADEDKKLANIEEVLNKVITDQYFREAQSAPEAQQDEKLEFARTMAWALTYYLAEKHPDRLMAYLNNLAKLPRHMDFDKRVLKELFVQSVLDSDADGKKFTRLAKNWLSTMQRDVTLEVPDIWKDAKKARADAEAARKKKEDESKQPPPEGGKPPMGGSRDGRRGN
jgi:hypothetical protein